MRAFAMTFLFLSALLSQAQDDAGMMAAQQAQMAAAQQAAEANQQAMQAAQQANQQAMDDAAQASANACCAAGAAAKPHFSVKAGTYPSTVTVRLKTSTRRAAMYYTTDGWTPTTHSTRYTGPIHIRSTTTLQAIAIAPGLLSSRIASAVYQLPAKPQPKTATSVAFLSQGTPLPLMFTASVNSKGLQIGDKLPVSLAQDLIVSGTLVAKKDTPVLTTVTAVDSSGLAGAPGTISFAAHSLLLTDGETIPLSGGETLDGRSRANTAGAFGLIPWIGLGGLLIHGKNAVIPKGAEFTAFVDTENTQQTAEALPSLQPE